jgi:hypothetical protein
MLRKTISESSEPVVGRLGIVNMHSVGIWYKPRDGEVRMCAHEWGGWGRISEDGPGQNNPDRSEGPWGRAAVRSHGGAYKAHHP